MFFFLKSFTHESLGSLPRRRPKGGFGRTAWRMRGRLELGLPVAFYADWFLIAGEQQIKIHSYSKNKETSKIHNDKSIASKSVGKYFTLPLMPSSTQRRAVAQVAPIFSKSCSNFLKKLLKSCSKTLKVAQKLPQNPKVAQKLLSIF